MFNKHWGIKIVNKWNGRLSLGNITIEEVFLLKRMRCIL